MQSKLCFMSPFLLHRTVFLLSFFFFSASPTMYFPLLPPLSTQGSHLHDSIAEHQVKCWSSLHWAFNPSYLFSLIVYYPNSSACEDVPPLFAFPSHLPQHPLWHLKANYPQSQPTKRQDLCMNVSFFLCLTPMWNSKIIWVLWQKPTSIQIHPLFLSIAFPAPNTPQTLHIARVLVLIYCLSFLFF